MQLRPYQQESVDAVFSEYANGINKQLISLSTGLGKTFIAGNVIQQLPLRLSCQGRVLWLTHRENLIDQSALSVLKVLFPDNATIIDLLIGEAGGIVNFMSAKHDLFGNPNCATTFQLLKNEIGIIKQTLFNIQPKLVVASVQTIVNRLDRIPSDHFDLIVVDECHRALSNSFSAVLNHFTPKIRLGLSGTPYRLDGLSLGDLFDKIIIDKDLKFGIDNKFLCEIEAIQLKTNIDLDGVKSMGADLSQSDLRIVDCPERNDQIVDAWLKHSLSPCGNFRRKTIGFCVDIEHAKNLTQAFVDAGARATFVVSDENECPNRKERIQMFENGEIDVMLNVDIFTEGADFKDIGMSIAARPTKSKTVFLQGPIGRATRLKSQWFVDTFGGQNAIVLDITDNCKKHSLINTWTLEGKKRFEERVFMGASRKADLIHQRDKRSLEHNQERTERYNLLSLPQVVVQMIDNREPTPAMLNFLKGLGLYVEGNHYTFGQVSELIGNSPASYSEMQHAMKYGYDVSNGMTKVQFGKVKNEIAERLSKQAIALDARFKNSPFIGLK